MSYCRGSNILLLYSLYYILSLKTPTYNNNITIIQSSVFNLQRITDLINNLKTRQDNKERLTESDYNLIMAAILPYYFAYNNQWIIGPET